MHGAQDFLAALAVVLGVAAVPTVVFQRLHQPVVLGYMIAGIIVGPHLPIPLVAIPPSFTRCRSWRTAADLHGHVRAGAQVVVEALATQSQSTVTTPSHPR